MAGRIGFMGCALCRNRFIDIMFGREPCSLYEMDGCDARDPGCSRYEPETDDDRGSGMYTPSSTAGDYGPGNPWDAPGMSIRDFI